MGAIGALLLIGMPFNQIQRTGDFGERFAAYVQIDHGGGQPVSYTHLTLPTIYSV